MKDRNTVNLRFQHDGKHTYHFYTAYNKTSGVIPADYKDKLATFINNLDKNAKLEDNETVYVTSLSELPPYKLKNYIQENKFNITTARKFEKLDTIIISDSFIKKNYIDLKRYDYNTRTWTTDSEQFLTFPINLILKDSKFKKYIMESKDYWYDISLINRNTKATHYIVEINEFKKWITQDPHFKTILDHKDTEIIDGYAIEQSHGNKKVCDALPFLLNLLDNVKKHNIKVVLDDSLQEDINKGLVVDFETFETLYGMLKSSDMDSWEIAKEIVANSEFESSKPYLIFLYYVFPELRKRSMNKNHMFVRNALYKFYDGPTSGKVQTMDLNDLLSSLGKKCPQYLEQQMSCFAHHLNALAGKTIVKEIVLA
jgi:hypothetical protein